MTTIDSTDYELVRACGEAMGYDNLTLRRGRLFYRVIGNRSAGQLYNPLYDDAQAMSLVKRFKLVLEPDGEWAATWINKSREPGKQSVSVRHAPTLNRAIVECVARMTSAVIDKADG